MDERIFNRYLAQFRGGDNSGFGEIYKEYSKKVLGAAILITKNKVWAEEATSMVFMNLLKLAHNSDVKIENPDAYIYRAAKNTAINVKMAEAYNKAELNEEMTADADASEHIEYLLDFERAISGLSEKHKDCAILHYVYGKKYKEIAKKYGVTEKAVEHYFEDIKIHLRKYFKNYK